METQKAIYHTSSPLELPGNLLKRPTGLFRRLSRPSGTSWATMRRGASDIINERSASRADPEDISPLPVRIVTARAAAA